MSNKFKESRDKADALSKMPVYPGLDWNNLRFDPCCAVIEELYTEELDKMLTALDNVKFAQAHRLTQVINYVATPMQLKCFDMVVMQKREYTAVAKELNANYFSVYSALHGQVNYTGVGVKRLYGGLFSMVRQTLDSDPGFQFLRISRRDVVSGNLDAISYWQEINYEDGPIERPKTKRTNMRKIK